MRNLTDDVVDIRLGECYTRPPRQASLSTEVIVGKHYGVITLPTMCTGTTEMADLRNRGVQCYGIGPANDRDGAAFGFGAPSGQERILISEQNRCVRFKWDVFIDLAARQ